MRNRRDLLLEQMGIPQWVLAKPHVLKGDAQIRIPPDIQLLVICEENHSQSAYFRDILHSLNLKTKQSQWLNLEQAQRLEIPHSPWIWLIDATPQAGILGSKFAKMTTWQSTSWQSLKLAKHKRELWQQLQAFSVPKEHHD